MTTVPQDPSPAAPERVILDEFLNYYRVVFRRKAEGLDDEAARTATCPPSELTIMGLVRHMAEVERSWFRRGIAGEDAAPIYYSDDDHDGDLHVGPTDTLDEALVTWEREVGLARAILADAALDDLDRLREEYSVRWILVHMIEEYARHCGHLDLIREAIDGTTGD
ncbi:MAG TPA: DinB family protein [Ilumatobacteraceae bacterium]|nr:DinB family protein [Ilumatobacteraceae bacterium]